MFCRDSGENDLISPKSYPESYPVRYQRILNAARDAFVALLSGGVWSWSA